MKIAALEELKHYVDHAKITAPEFEINGGRLMLTPHPVNFTIIMSFLMLPLSIVTYKHEDAGAPLVSIALLGMALYLLWFEYNARNKVEIDFDNDQIFIRYQSPFRLLLSFMKEHRQRSFPTTSLSGFLCKKTAQRSARYRLYAERKDLPDILLIDFSSEEHAEKVTDYLNKAMKEIARKQR
jgi:hypothetical protein